MTSAEIVNEMMRLSVHLEEATKGLVDASRRSAECDHAYKICKAHEYLKSNGKTVAERESQSLLATSEAYLQDKLADGEKMSSLELVRSLRAQLSALQSVANAVRAEAELARMGTTA